MENVLSTSTTITALFIVLAVALWFGATQLTDNAITQGIVLLGVGVIIPTAINEYRRQKTNTTA